MDVKWVGERVEDWVAKWVASSAVLMAGHWVNQRAALTVLRMVGWTGIELVDSSDAHWDMHSVA